MYLLVKFVTKLNDEQVAADDEKKKEFREH